MYLRNDNKPLNFLFRFLFSIIEGGEVGRPHGYLESSQHSTHHQEGIFKLLKEPIVHSHIVPTYVFIFIAQ